MTNGQVSSSDVAFLVPDWVMCTWIFLMRDVCFAVRGRQMEELALAEAAHTCSCLRWLGAARGPAVQLEMAALSPVPGAPESPTEWQSFPKEAAFKTVMKMANSRLKVKGKNLKTIKSAWRLFKQTVLEAQMVHIPLSQKQKSKKGQ